MVESYWFSGGSVVLCGCNKNQANVLLHCKAISNPNCLSEAYSDNPVRSRQDLPTDSNKLPYMKVYYERRLAT